MLSDMAVAGARTRKEKGTQPLFALDFFSGSGLVRLGLQSTFETIWANDNCPRKADVYSANFIADRLEVRGVEEISGLQLPAADLAWASFPCQDLSLAGNLKGMKKGTRSGLFWEWIRILDTLSATGRRPPVLCAENVVGFLSVDGGNHFRAAYHALRERGYNVGAIVIDARLFLPQSRPRAFLIASAAGVPLQGLTQHEPSSPFHPPAVRRAASALNDDGWIWWALPAPTPRALQFADLCELDAPCNPPEKTAELLSMLSLQNRRKLDGALAARSLLIGTGYRRTRPCNGIGKVQRLELRFDDIAGCLRTPDGGSSRQVVLIVEKGQVRSRLMTVRECARLMGAPDEFRIPGTYNQGYRAMGDAVAVPVTAFLARHLLKPLANRYRAPRTAS
jgi:DNA (cytosine-5)-methyltransferase 1